MIEKIKQFKNLIFLVVAIVIFVGCLVADPLGYYAARRQYRANIANQIAIAKAETAKRIAIIQAETEAELLRIRASGVKFSN